MFNWLRRLLSPIIALEVTSVGPKDALLVKRWVIRTLLGTLRLHHLLRADQNREPHDHPWGFFTWVIKGRYEEAVMCVHEYGTHFMWVRRERWSLAYRGAEHTHKIIEVSEGGCWTICLTGWVRRPWGFWTDTNPPTFRPYVPGEDKS